MSMWNLALSDVRSPSTSEREEFLDAIKAWSVTATGFRFIDTYQVVARKALRHLRHEHAGVEGTDGGFGGQWRDARHAVPGGRPWP